MAEYSNGYGPDMAAAGSSCFVVLGDRVPLSRCARLVAPMEEIETWETLKHGRRGIQIGPSLWEQCEGSPWWFRARCGRQDTRHIIRVLHECRRDAFPQMPRLDGCERMIGHRRARPIDDDWLFLFSASRATR